MTMEERARLRSWAASVRDRHPLYERAGTAQVQMASTICHLLDRGQTAEANNLRQELESSVLMLTGCLIAQGVPGPCE